ncbi:MAG: tRNA (guanosine(37)-N1)-methyltransferase TrmD [Proteobacteria bacterium]|nr:tRNA (guanosine(37)-N1)-methyltransferase TrmD [Pseudomonadota bacterium]
MKVAILTIFPALFESFLESSLIKKARDRALLEVSLINIRDFADPPHYQVDDIPYGGGAGMVMKPEPLMKAIAHAKAMLPNASVVLLSPAGELFSQRTAYAMANADMILLCGRYEGIDQRVIDMAVDRELSLGDYVIMGGEVAAMVVIEATARLVPGVIGNTDSLTRESFTPQPNEDGLLEAPQYTRPAEFNGLAVPEVLLSGNHKLIAEWRAAQSTKLTAERRPDLVKQRKTT